MSARQVFSWQTGYACLDGGIFIVCVDVEDSVHFAECDTECVFGCDDCAFDTGAGAVGNDRYLMFRADFNDIGDFGVGFREGDGIWAGATVIGGVACVCVSDGVICAEARSEEGAEFFVWVF